MKLRLNDKVVVITGKDKGKTGLITKILRKQDRVIVEKVNMRTKHIKKTTERAGEKITYEAPIHVSNVMLICPQTNKRTRIGYKKTKDGKKVRISKKSNEVVDTESKKTKK